MRTLHKKISDFLDFFWKSAQKWTPYKKPPLKRPTLLEIFVKFTRIEILISKLLALQEIPPLFFGVGLNASSHKMVVVAGYGRIG